MKAARLSIWMATLVAVVGARTVSGQLQENEEIVSIEAVAGEGQDPVAHQQPHHEGGEFARYVYGDVPLLNNVIEAVPSVLSWPDRPLGHLFGAVTGAHHDRLHVELEEHPIGIQRLPQRPPLLLELNELFLAPGFLPQGIETPTGAIWRPSLWVFGEYRTAVQYYDANRGIDPTVEWANRWDLFSQLNLTGTERVLFGLRPLDEERGNSRTFSGYDFNNGNSINGFNADVQTLFFEGDFGELFPWLDPYDTRFLDYGFSVGRMPLLAQQGLLINEDMIDAVTVTRNTLNGNGNLNLRMTGVYSWNAINRNSSTVGTGNQYDPGSQMVALLTESDFAKRTVNADVAYVYSDDARFDDVLTFGVSAIRRHYGYHNTYNTSFHLLSSYATNQRTAYADNGQLLFSQISWTPHHTEDLIYLNGFWAIDQFTSPARGPLMGGPLGQTGVLFAGAALGNFGAPLPGAQTNNRAGGSLGYQLFFDHTRQQVIWEVGGHKETKGPANTGVVATGIRYQRAFGQHLILVVDGAVAKPEGANLGQGARVECRVKY